MSATLQEIDRGEEPDGLPVEPIQAKKQKKEKTQVSVKVKEPGHEERDRGPGSTLMDRYMELASWDIWSSRDIKYLFYIMPGGDSHELSSSQ